jgi:hypothetical protein
MTIRKKEVLLLMDLAKEDCRGSSFVSQNLPHEKSQASLVWIVEEGGVGIYRSMIEVVKPPYDLVIDGTFASEILL